jgi:hypothetical protein
MIVVAQVNIVLEVQCGFNVAHINPHHDDLAWALENYFGP